MVVIGSVVFGGMIRGMALIMVMMSRATLFLCGLEEGGIEVKATMSCSLSSRAIRFLV